MLYSLGAIAYCPNHAVDGPAGSTVPLLSLARSGRGAAPTAPGPADTKRTRADMTQLLPRLARPPIRQPASRPGWWCTHLHVGLHQAPSGLMREPPRSHPARRESVTAVQPCGWSARRSAVVAWPASEGTDLPSAPPGIVVNPARYLSGPGNAGTTAQGQHGATSGSTSATAGDTDGRGKTVTINRHHPPPDGDDHSSSDLGSSRTPPKPHRG